MNVSMTGAIVIAALAIAGCETLNGPQASANADAQRANTECTNIRLSSAAKQLRLDGIRGPAPSQTPGEKPIEETEGDLAVGHAQINPPAALRSRIAPEENLTAKAQREC